MGSGLLVGEIEYLKVDRYTTNAASDLEGIDAFIDKVAEELRPGTLLPVGAYQTPGSPVWWYRPAPAAGSRQDTSGCRVGPWCQNFPVSLRRRAVATASASVTRRNRR